MWLANALYPTLFAIVIFFLIWSVLTGSCFKHVVPRYWSFWEALESLGCGACECKSLGPGLWRCDLASTSWSENTWHPSFMLLMHRWGVCVSPWAATPRNCELKYITLHYLATARYFFSLCLDSLHPFRVEFLWLLPFLDNLILAPNLAFERGDCWLFI